MTTSSQSLHEPRVFPTTDAWRITQPMGRPIQISLEMPDDLAEFRLPDAVNRRLHHLLDLQDRGQSLSTEEREEAESLVNIAEVLTLLRLRAKRAFSPSVLSVKS